MDDREAPVRVTDVMTESNPRQYAFLKMRIERELRHFSGVEMPQNFLLAWHAFLYGNLVGAGISIPDYNKLEAMLPPLQNTDLRAIEEIALGREFDDDELDAEKETT